MSALVLAPAAFKGACSALEAANALAAGARLAGTPLEIRIAPVADGGEGTLDTLLAARGGTRHLRRVSDPLGREVVAAFGLLPDGTCVVELAQASGYERLTATERDPEATSTFGTGQLIAAGLDSGATRIIVTVGGSATTDAGLGLARALGAKILDADGNLLAGTGGELERVARIDLSGLDPRLHECQIEVACDVDNPLSGPRGAAVVFGPQKGATPDAVRRLDRGLAHIGTLFGRPLAGMPGAGAAGGAAAGLVGLLGATIVDGAALVLDTIDISQTLADATLCITGEGRLDPQTLSGKAPAAVATACRSAGVPCVGVCGELTVSLEILQELGLVAAFPIGRTLRGLPAALAETLDDLTAIGAAILGLWGSAEQSTPRQM